MYTLDEMDNSGLASFTALPREEWNEIRNKLIEDENNKYNLDVISDAISMVYLESNSPPIDVRYTVYTILYHTVYHRI